MSGRKYRDIVVDGTTYQYIVGRGGVKITGIGYFPKWFSNCGKADTYVHDNGVISRMEPGKQRYIGRGVGDDKVMVTPAMVADAIRHSEEYIHR